jgi:hypothetical protein
MSWFILDEACVNSPSLLVLEVESLEGHFSAGEPSVPSSSPTTPEECFLLVSEMGSSRVFQCGTMSEPSAVSPGGGGWTSSLAGSHAKTFQPRELPSVSETALTESGQDFGQRCAELLAKWDQGSSSWRTRQLSLFEDSTGSLETLPRWGSTVGGELFQDHTPAHLTSARESGLWPTPTKSDATRGPTTPERNDKGLGGVSLISAATHWTDPVTREIKKDAPRGKLNPTWVEWLMGFPMGWTDLKPLETHRFHRWLRLHGGPCHD